MAPLEIPQRIEPTKLEERSEPMLDILFPRLFTES
jgi:hypothetical protein